MKGLAVYLLPTGLLVHPSATSSIKFTCTYLYTWVKTRTVRENEFAQEHMFPAMTQARNACSGVERVNHEATAPLWERKKRQTWSMDVYSFFPGRAQISDVCLKKTKWIGVSYWKTSTGVDLLQHLIPDKFIASLQLSRVLDFDSVIF